MIPTIKSMILLLMIEEKNRINPITIIEPMKAAASTVINPITEKSPLANTPLLPKMTSATPKFAPELIPKINEPAKRLLKANYEIGRASCRERV